MSLIMPYIKGNIGNFIPKLYQLRLIFKNQEYQRAYEEISNLWNNDEENMLLMNETAVYAYHAGKIEEAEELFSKLRELYPHNAQVLHNESIFLKFKSRMLSERHRKQQDNMQKKNSSV
jgi:Tfp pilus assembly protein PilF